MTYVKVSIPKKNAGVAVAKDSNVLVMFVEDILTEPTRSLGDVRMTGNYTLATGAKAVGLYLTPSTIALGYDSEGEEDGKGFKQKVEGEHPGNDVSMENFIEGAANKGVVILVKNCDGQAGVTKAFGSKCAPLYLSPECTDSKDGNKVKLAFAQGQAQSFLPGIYTGTLPTVADPEAEGSTSESA